MLVIREEQMKTLSESTFNYFVDLMVAHLRKFFPELVRDKDDDVLRETVCHGVEHADKYGIVAGHDVCLFTQLRVLFGPDFDENPELPWAGETLSVIPFPNATEKTKSLHEAAVLHLQSNAKPVHQNLAAAGTEAFRIFSDLPVRPAKSESPPQPEAFPEADPGSGKRTGNDSPKGL